MISDDSSHTRSCLFSNLVKSRPFAFCFTFQYQRTPYPSNKSSNNRVERSLCLPMPVGYLSSVKMSIYCLTVAGNWTTLHHKCSCMNYGQCPLDNGHERLNPYTSIVDGDWRCRPSLCYSNSLLPPRGICKCKRLSLKTENSFDGFKLQGDSIAELSITWTSIRTMHERTHHAELGTVSRPTIPPFSISRYYLADNNIIWQNQSLGSRLQTTFLARGVCTPTLVVTYQADGRRLNYELNECSGIPLSCRPTHFARSHNDLSSKKTALYIEKEPPYSWDMIYSDSF